MKLEKYSMGIGDRFGRQGRAQLGAVAAARDLGLTIAPVWNKSHREHTIVGSRPTDVRTEADSAAAALGWTGSFYVDADHVGLANVDLFIESSDFFTLDVADFIGRTEGVEQIEAFVRRHHDLIGTVEIPGIGQPLAVSEAEARRIAGKFLGGVHEVGRIYRHIAGRKGADNFVTEVSMDETALPQTPVEMLFILAGLADEGVPAQTIAPKFSGRFNKGVDYVGDVAGFAREFEDDLCVIAHAVEAFGLPENLKLSIHSGSDKFSIYGPMGETLRRRGAGVHLKTAGTTWLEELIGLAEAGGEGLAIAREIYRSALGRFDELCGPYLAVVDIDKAALPDPDEVEGWDGARFAAALRHDPACADYNRHFRQLLHVAYKVAAEMGPRYLAALDAHEAIVARNVAENILERHIKPLFVG